MCLALPGRIESLDEEPTELRMGWVRFGTVRREVCLAYVPEAKEGDWVIVHAGFAIQIIDEATAEESLRYLREAAQFLVENDDSGTAANG